MGKQTLHLQLPYDLYAALKQLAADRDTTMTGYLTGLLCEQLMQDEKDGQQDYEQTL